MKTKMLKVKCPHCNKNIYIKMVRDKYFIDLNTCDNCKNKYIISCNNGRIAIVKTPIPIHTKYE